MTVTKAGRRSWSLNLNEDGERVYTLVVDAETDDFDDGPHTVLYEVYTLISASVGSVWSWGNDSDPWAFLTPRATVRPRVEGEKSKLWRCTFTWSTKGRERCQDQTIEDPLMEPAKISGSFVAVSKEATVDKDGDAIKSSSHEVFRGPQIEFDDTRASVIIEQNVPLLELDIITDMVQTVNDAPMWGLANRSIKMDNFSWERKYYGVCNVYFTRRLEFSVVFDSFDRTILDQGTKVFDDVNFADNAGNRADPTKYRRYTDTFGNIANTLLDGNGSALAVGGNPTKITVQYYKESNFLELGIPSDLEF